MHTYSHTHAEVESHFTKSGTQHADVAVFCLALSHSALAWCGQQAMPARQATPNSVKASRLEFLRRHTASLPARSEPRYASQQQRLPCDSAITCKTAATTMMTATITASPGEQWQQHQRHHSTTTSLSRPAETTAAATAKHRRQQRPRRT